MDEEFGRELSEEFRENRKLLWKEVTKEKGSVEDMCECENEEGRMEFY